MDYQTITAELKNRGYRLTAARTHVVRELCKTPSYLGAYDIYSALKRTGVKVGIASIYRVLDLLFELNLVQREEFGSGGEKFRLAQGGHTHQLVCSNCGAAKEFVNCSIHALAQALEDTSGFKIQDHWLRFFGLCPNCQHKSGSK